jgi:murein hydrolase activator
MNRVVVFICLILCAIGTISGSSVTAYDKKIKEQKRALLKLEKELNAQRAQIKELKNQEQGVLNTISLLERNLDQSKQFLKTLQENESTLSRSIGLNNRQLDSMNVALNGQKKMMAMRIRSLYMQGDPLVGRLREIKNYQSNLARYALYMRSVLLADQKLVTRIQQTQSDILGRQRALINQKEALAQAREKKGREQQLLAEKKENQANFLQNIQTSRQLQAKALAEFEANQKMLQGLVRRLEKERKEAVKKGKKPKIQKPTAIAAQNKCWPMQGSIISRYGNQRHPQLKTITRNLGIEIRGAPGRSVKAAAPGTVAMVTRIQGHGIGIIIDHGGAVYTVYGHMQNVKVKEGQALRRCQELGNPGDEDSMDGIKLYFQVSEGTHTIDPLKWLEKAR